MPYQESNQYKKQQPHYGSWNSKQGIGEGTGEYKLLEHIAKIDALIGNPEATINAIDDFCQKNWMMNLGNDKGKIVRAAIQKYKPKTILEIGGYCGYSSLLMASVSGGHVHSIEPNPSFIKVAQGIHKHAGIANQITIHQGIIQTNEEFIKNTHFDMIFIDHLKNLYLPDFLWLQERGVIKKGTVVVGDNIILPGSPDYLAYFKQSNDYDSVLYHTNIEYADDADAVLVSLRIT